MPIGELFAVGSALLWALNSVLLRPVTRRMPALQITALQYVSSAILMVAAAALLGRLQTIPAIPLMQLAGLLGSALIGMGVGDTIYIRALSLLGVSRCYPVSQASFVLFTLALGATLLGEPVTPIMMLGAASLLVGILLLSQESSGGKVIEDGPSPAALRRGVVIALCAGFCWSIATLLLRVGLVDVDVLAANALREPLVAVALCSVAGGRHGLDYRVYGRRDLILVVVAGIAGLWASSLLFLTAIQMAGAIKVAVLTSTSPMFAALLAVLFLHERFTLRLALGTVAAVVGMLLAV